MPKRLLFFLFVCVFLLVLAFLWPKKNTQAPAPQVKNFEECVAAGNRVMESYPRQCTTSKGENFIETFISE